MASAMRVHHLLHWNYLQEFWRMQGEWSQAVFGPDSVRGPNGPLKHLEKEVKEVQANPTDIEEYADCMFLIVDAARRAGFTCARLTEALFEKLDKNKARNWPPFDPTKVNEAVEHVRVSTEENHGQRRQYPPTMRED